MRTIFNLAFTLLIIGAIWYLVIRVIDVMFCGNRLNNAYWPPFIIIACSTLTLIVILLIKLWR